MTTYQRFSIECDIIEVIFIKVVVIVHNNVKSWFIRSCSIGLDEINEAICPIILIW